MIDVYCLTSPSGRRYVGIASVGVDSRWLAHVSRASKGGSVPLSRAIRKYGPGAFTRVVLERCETWADACVAERKWISSLDTHASRGGYNATLGGDGTLGFFPGAETRQKMSRAHVDRVRSPEHVAALKLNAAERRGVSLTPEHRRKLSAARKKRVTREDTRAKMSASMRAHWADPESRQAQSAATRAAVSTPECRAKRIAASKAVWARPEHRQKHAHSMRGNTNNLGNKASSETRAKMSASHRGKVCTEEQRERMRAAQILRREQERSGVLPRLRIAPAWRAA